MKAPLIAAVLGFAVAMTGCGPGVDMNAVAAASTAKVGQAAPDFTLVDSTGQPRSLADYAGKTVVLEWTNHGCPFVRKHYGAGNMQAQQREATAAGVIWLTINSSAPGKQGHVDGAGAEEVRAGAKAAQTAYLLDHDGTVGRAYGAVTTPHMYVIDPDGVLRYAGAIDSIASTDEDDIEEATQYVPQALAELAAGQPVSVTLTRPYGCDVKYAN
jgi:peroxiredoxin